MIRKVIKFWNTNVLNAEIHTAQISKVSKRHISHHPRTIEQDLEYILAYVSILEVHILDFYSCCAGVVG